MSRIVDWITGRNKAVAAAEAEARAARAARRKAEGYAEQLAALNRRAGPEAVKRVAGQARPGEVLLPAEVARMRDMHDHPRNTTPTLSAQAKQQAREATRMAYTATPQPPPSRGGPGQTFVNPRAVRQSIWKGDMAQAEKDAAAAQARPRENEHDKTRDPSDGGGRKR